MRVFAGIGAVAIATLSMAQPSKPLGGMECRVLQIAIAFALHDSTQPRKTAGWLLYSKTVSPWPGWNKYSQAQRERQVQQAGAALAYSPESLAVLAGAQGRDVPRCPAELVRVRWLAEVPANQSDTSIVEVSSVAFSPDSSVAIVSVGWSNRWVGQGMLLRLDLKKGSWVVSKQADTWME